MPRKTILNDEFIADFAKEIQEGLPIQYTCDYFGITQPCYNNWMRRGEEELEQGLENYYTAFFLAIKKAYSCFIRESRNAIRSGKPGWQGTAWWLERTNATFMPKQQILPDADGKVQVVIGGKVKEVRKTDDNDKR